MARMYKSAFCGVIDEIPGIRVDNFERPEEVKARAYFLSHCHSDHTQGLYTESLINTLMKTGACLYMTEPTAAIIEDETTDKRIMEFIRPLKLGSTVITLPANDNINEKHITVTLIPAGHSFGSVMFLFQTDSKTVLFTGDFRMSPNDLPKYNSFHTNNEPITIDTMYVDTTFVNQEYLNFPKRSESIEATIEEIRKWIRKDGNGVALHTSAKYGYEFVYNKIYEELGIKVYVNDARWKLYSKMQHLVKGVTNEPTKIHICTNRTEKKDHTKCMTTIHSAASILYIHFSAMKWDNFEEEDNVINRISDIRFDVCFATHCSRSELLYFVNYFNTNKVVGFPEKFPQKEKKIEDVKVPTKKRKMADCKKELKKCAMNVDKKVSSELLKKIFEI